MTGLAPHELAREEQRLVAVQEVLDAVHRDVEQKVADAEGSITRHRALIWEQQRDMDHAEKANLRVEVDTASNLASEMRGRLHRLERLRRSPYFARVDFQTESDAAPTDADGGFYIGVHSFRDPESFDLLVHDWRAPVSSLYYDYETGPARFTAPSGIVDGEIVGKRQYKIAEGELVFAIESSLNIGDEMLQAELSRSGDERMKDIVSTIQREQNAAIRNEDAEVLILQGVAGSGKTSIALHRIAYILYRFKDDISAEDVLILSPNKVFGDYISDVLPELGEEQVPEIDAETLAREHLPKGLDFETFPEQVAALLEKEDPAYEERIRSKATPAFAAELEAWVLDRAAHGFEPQLLTHRHEVLERDWLEERWATGGWLPVFSRVTWIAEAAVNELKRLLPRTSRWTAADTRAVRKQVAAMFPDSGPLAMYEAFHRERGTSHLVRKAGRRRLEYSDVFPVIRTAQLTTRSAVARTPVRHLLIDEMQDYTAVQYAVLRDMFGCRMTILGDANQSVNPLSSSNKDDIAGMFPTATTMELTKSYRSTRQITEFAQQISRNERLTPVSREGEEPEIIALSDEESQTAAVHEWIRGAQRDGYGTLGVITRTISRARELASTLRAEGTEVNLLDYESTSFAAGVVITSAHLAKGLEFDAVLVPDVDQTTYARSIDRSMLYIATTRAMHRLTLTHTGTHTEFL